jgi:hypothetical protein
MGFELSRSVHHDHNRYHDRYHDYHHTEKHQRALYHVSKHAEPSAFRQQIHATFWALSTVRLTNFRMHGAKIDFSRVFALIHLTSLPELILSLNIAVRNL